MVISKGTPRRRIKLLCARCNKSYEVLISRPVSWRTAFCPGCGDQVVVARY